MYEKGYHMIWHDCIGKEAYNDVENWMQKRIMKTSNQLGNSNETCKKCPGDEIVLKSENGKTHDMV